MIKSIIFSLSLVFVAPSVGSAGIIVIASKVFKKSLTEKALKKVISNSSTSLRGKEVTICILPAGNLATKEFVEKRGWDSVIEFNRFWLEQELAGKGSVTRVSKPSEMVACVKNSGIGYLAEGQEDLAVGLDIYRFE